MELLSGKCVGGPSDGVTVSAPGTWDGKIKKITRRGSALVRYHPGHYEWNVDCWQWVPGEVTSAPKPATEKALQELQRWYNRFN